MIQYKKFVSMVTAATTAMVMTVGFNSYAADNTSDVMYAAHQMPVSSLAEWFESAPEAAVDETAKSAEIAQEKYKRQQEEIQAAEEARKAEEAAEKAAAERAAAEQAAAEQAAAEQAAAQNAMQVNVEEQALLAALIFCEAGNQPYEGQVAVGAVVMNRVRNSAYPNSISEVIYQSGQFSPAMSGWLDSVLASGGYTDAARQAAADAIAGSNPIGDFLYFDCGGVGYQLGDHFFH